jgi:two-component system NtrC family sensor kinase
MQAFIDLNSLIYLLAVAINLGLSVFIFSKDRKSEVNQSLGLLIFFVALWVLCAFLLRIQSVEWLLFLRKLSTFSSSLIVVFFLYFSFVFPQGEEPLSYTQRALILLPGFTVAFLSIFSSLMIRGYVVKGLAFPVSGAPVYGALYPLAIFYYLTYVGWALFNLVSKYIKSQGRQKLQIFYVLFGIGTAGLAGLTTSLILPIFNLPQYAFWGPPFTLIMAFFLVYAMVAYRLLGIEDFLSRGIIYLALAMGMVGTFAIVQIGSLSFIPSFYIALFNLALGTLVYFQNRRSPINISFSILIFIVAIWAFSIGMFLESTRLEHLFFWSRVYYFLAAFLPGVFLYFSTVFPIEGPFLSRPQRLLIFMPGIIFVPIVLFSNLIVREFYVRPDGIDALTGAAYPYYTIYYLIFMGYGFFNLFRKYRKVSSVDKIRIRYVFWGVSILGITGTIFNMILPWLGNYRLIWLGPYSSVFLSGLVSYAIVVHRLMSVEVVVQRAFIYTMATGLIMALYAVAVLLSERFFRGLFRYSSAFLTGLAALMIAVAYQPLVRGFQNLTDRLFFRGRYDYQKTLREISHKIASVIRLEELSKLIVSSFVDTMKISEISFLLQDREKEHFRSVSLSVPRYKKIEIDVGSPIISWLTATKDILFRDEIEDEISRQEALGKEGEEQRRNLEEVRDEMDRLGISIWVPIISKDELIGVIALGNKLSGDIFTTEDIGLLSTLASQTAVALDNARLYDEVVNMKDYSEKILQSMVSGMLTVDIKGRIVTYNYMAEKITGRKTAEVLGKTCEEIWGKRGMVPNIIENTLKKGKYYVNFESSIASPERGLVPVSFSSTQLYDHQGKKMGALLSIQDLSEVKELEEKVRRADKLAALATMAAGMAHEIKNPLSSMKVFSQLLPKKIDDPEYRKKLGEIIPREISRIDRIVESLLGFARATALNFEKTDIKEILEENLKYFEEQARESEIKIIRNYAELPEVEVDRGQISQVFSNLILNAIQAMSGGGELKISVMPAKKVEDIIQSVKIQVSDTGHGISEDMAKKLFDPFFTTKYGGTGLGLTIAHSIVDGHKGFIDVTSKPGKGTTFTITLPLHQ